MKMDLIYTVSRRSWSKSHSQYEWLHEGHPVSCISTRNTLAFTSTSRLDDPTGRSWRCHVYVCDLNNPWQVYRVLEHNVEVTCLEWDMSASKLLVADVEGNIEIWQMKDFLLNDWCLLTSADFPGERILCAAWFHNGKKMTLNSERKESHLYSEKFTPARFGQTIRQFGGRPREGCIAITATGLVCVMILNVEGPSLISTECLATVRSQLKVVDLCYCKSGDFLVAASDGSIASAIHCYKVTLKIIPGDAGFLDTERCVIVCQSLPSFFPNSFSTAGSEKPYTGVTHLRFILREGADAVVVCAAGKSESAVQLWELREKQIPLHKMFSGPNSEAKFKTVSWHPQSVYESPSHVVSLATPHMTMYDSNPPPSYILAAYKDSTINCFQRESLQLVCSITIHPSFHHRDDGGVKQSRVSTTISNLQLTWSGSALIAIDTVSQLYLYRLSPITDPGGPVSAQYATTVLEYCLITGYDWWDVLLALRPGLIETICERMTETFNRQPSSQQQYLFSRFIALKMSMYRFMTNGQCKAGDCFALLMLNAVATSFRSLLRPTDMSTQDKSPAENLTAIVSSKQTMDIVDLDKVLLNFEKNKEFCVEAPTLQSLQQLIQWVGDFTLYLMASLPYQYQSQTRFPGCGLLHDVKALTTLRELLVVIRVWGLIRHSCLPVFTKTAENLDVLALLFRLLTRTIAKMGSEPDDILDECLLLPNQVLIPTLTFGLEAQGVASPALFMNSLPLPFDYNVEPEFMKYRLDLPLLEGSYPNFQKYDIVRHTYLGIRPPTHKKCTRCWSASILKPPAKSVATKAWDQRWLRACPCGGHWSVVNY